MAIIQQVYFAKEGYSIYIRAIKPDENNPESGLICKKRTVSYRYRL